MNNIVLILIAIVLALLCIAITFFVVNYLYILLNNVWKRISKSKKKTEK